MRRFVFLACLLLLPSTGWATTASIMGVADTGRVDPGKRMKAYAGSKVEISHLAADTLQTFLMVAGQRATTKYVASDTLRTDLITGLTDTNTGLSWLGPDSLALVTGAGNRLTVGSDGKVYVPGDVLVSNTGRLLAGVAATPGNAFPHALTANYAKTETNTRGIVILGTNEGSTSFGAKISFIGHAADANSRTISLQTGDDAVNAGILALQAFGGNVGIRKIAPIAPLDVAGTGLISSRFAVGSTDTTQAHFYVMRNIADGLKTGRFYQQNASGTGAGLEVEQAGTGPILNLVGKTNASWKAGSDGKVSESFNAATKIVRFGTTKIETVDTIVDSLDITFTGADQLRDALITATTVVANDVGPRANKKVWPAMFSNSTNGTVGAAMDSSGTDNMLSIRKIADSPTAFRVTSSYTRGATQSQLISIALEIKCSSIDPVITEY